MVQLEPLSDIHDIVAVALVSYVVDNCSGLVEKLLQIVEGGIHLHLKTARVFPLTASHTGFNNYWLLTPIP